MAEYLVNDKKLIVTPSSFMLASELRSEVLKTLSDAKLDVGGKIVGALDSSGEVSGDVLNEILNAVLSVASNPKIEDLLFKCADRAEIGSPVSSKVNKEYFENSANWVEYYPIMFYVLKENLEPFFGSVFSLVKAGGKTTTKNRK